jgi:hypothetical protein
MTQVTPWLTPRPAKVRAVFDPPRSYRRLGDGPMGVLAGAGHA